MSTIQQLATTITSITPSPEWRPVILSGPYLRRMRCHLALDAEGNVIDCDRIHSVLSNTPRFGTWFIYLYHPVFLDGGFGMSHQSGPAQHPDAESDAGE